MFGIVVVIAGELWSSRPIDIFISYTWYTNEDRNGKKYNTI